MNPLLDFSGMALRGKAGQGALPAKRGFVMTTEAMLSLVFLSLAFSSLLLFSFPKHDSEAFYLCSDAAIVLAKTGAFSQGSLGRATEELSDLSGMCIRAKTGFAGPQPCIGAQAGEKLALEIPVWGGTEASKATVFCSRPR